MRTVITALALAAALVPGLASAEQKIGFVDLQRALNEVDEGKTAKALLKKDFDDKQKEIDAKKADFEKLQADFEKQATMLSEQARKDKAQDLDKRARDLQALFVSAQKDLSDREQKATRGIFDKMAQIVGEIAEADGFTLVLEKNAGVVYAPASLDLTNELIRKYNARFPPSGPAKPAAASAKKAEPKKAEGAAAKR
jgi:outer membrane protein